MTDNPLLGAHSSSGWYFQNPGHHQKHFIILFDLPFFFQNLSPFSPKLKLLLHMNTPIRMSAIVLFNQQRIRDRQKREQLAEAFRKADKNGDGRLSVEEIHGIYQAHGVEVTREDVQKIVEAADKDGTGLLTEKEFVNSQAVGEVSSLLCVLFFLSSYWPSVVGLNPKKVGFRGGSHFLPALKSH